MPRARSSGSLSVSTPVSARISAVFPWSMWPAVPTVSGAATISVAHYMGALRRRRGLGGTAGAHVHARDLASIAWVGQRVLGHVVEGHDVGYRNARDLVGDVARGRIRRVGECCLRVVQTCADRVGVGALVE